MEQTLQLDPSAMRSEEHTSELQSLTNIVCRLLLEKKKKKSIITLQLPPSYLACFPPTRNDLCGKDTPGLRRNLRLARLTAEVGYAVLHAVMEEARVTAICVMASPRVRIAGIPQAHAPGG